MYRDELKAATTEEKSRNVSTNPVPSNRENPPAINPSKHAGIRQTTAPTIITPPSPISVGIEENILLELPTQRNHRRIPETDPDPGIISHSPKKYKITLPHQIQVYYIMKYYEE